MPLITHVAAILNFAEICPFMVWSIQLLIRLYILVIFCIIVIISVTDNCQVVQYVNYFEITKKTLRWRSCKYTWWYFLLLLHAWLNDFHKCIKEYLQTLIIECLDLVETAWSSSSSVHQLRSKRAILEISCHCTAYNLFSSGSCFKLLFLW